MKVSVLVFAYNHVRFIRQALDSVLMQQTNFDFEVVVSEDCSTDGTREIVFQYARAHPDKIRLLLSAVNIGAARVDERGFNAARGEYIALLDGDDYWTSPHKLQEQVEFMGTHPEYSLCFHYQEYVDAEGRRMLYQYPHRSKLCWSLKDILEDCTIETSSALLRRSMLPPLPDWYFLCPFGDFPIWVLCVQNGPAGYLDRSLGAYRIHASGSFNGLKEWQQKLYIQYTYRHVYRHLDPQHQALVAKSFARRWASLAMQRRSEGDRLASREIAREGLADFPHDLRLQLLVHVSALYALLRSMWLVWKRFCGWKVQDKD
jgi:glycosyltransferase involved in cell wall biosynthesis